MADWPKIKAEYIRDDTTSYRKLCLKHGVSMGALRKRAKSEKWVELRAQKARKRDTRMVDACATKEAERAVKITDLADELLEKLGESMKNIEADDYDRMFVAAQILFRLKETKKGLSAADAREQEARIKKLEKEAESDAAAAETEFVFRVEGIPKSELEGIVG